MQLCFSSLYLKREIKCCQLDNSNFSSPDDKPSLGQIYDFQYIVDTQQYNKHYSQQKKITQTITDEAAYTCKLVTQILKSHASKSRRSIQFYSRVTESNLSLHKIKVTISQSLYRKN